MSDALTIAIRMFSLVHGYRKGRADDGMTEFFCLNVAEQEGWVKLAKEMQRKLRRAVNNALSEEH